MTRRPTHALAAANILESAAGLLRRFIVGFLRVQTDFRDEAVVEVSLVTLPYRWPQLVRSILDEPPMWGTTAACGEYPFHPTKGLCYDWLGAFSASDLLSGHEDRLIVSEPDEILIRGAGIAMPTPRVLLHAHTCGDGRNGRA